MIDYECMEQRIYLPFLEEEYNGFQARQIQPHK
jgi:hypothetical protein